MQSIFPNNTLLKYTNDVLKYERSTPEAWRESTFHNRQRFIMNLMDGPPSVPNPVKYSVSEASSLIRRGISNADLLSEDSVIRQLPKELYIPEI